LNHVIGRGLGCLGPVSCYLGRPADTAEAPVRAVEWYEAPLARCERMDARPRAALSRVRLGEALTKAGDVNRGACETGHAQAEMKRLRIEAMAAAR
jgi:hypothetical protein